MSIRLSVSAVRQYHRCPLSFYYARVQKFPQPPGPQAVFGTITHLAFYHAYAYPTMEGSQVVWTPTGEFSPKLALEVYDRLVQRRAEDAPSNPHEELLFSLAEPTDRFPLNRGPTKQLQSRDGWVAHYRNMLYRAFEDPLEPERIHAVEKQIEYQMADVDFLGYIDLVYEDQDGLVLIDLKTEYAKPSKNELTYNDQVARYYKAVPEAKAFWYYHLRSGEKFVVKRNDSFIRTLEAMDRQVASILTDDRLPDRIKYPPRFGDHCFYCTFKELCWSAETPSEKDLVAYG